jgi:methylated-DNA-protein-cysteine methyltransferase related protein
MSNFKEEVYRVVRSVPPGRVTSYGVIASLVGRPGAARAVGAALKALPDEASSPPANATDPGTSTTTTESRVPWWRILNWKGAISTSSIDHVAQIQRALLEDEGVEFDPGNRVLMDRFGWRLDVREE